MDKWGRDKWGRTFFDIFCNYDNLCTSPNDTSPNDTRSVIGMEKGDHSVNGLFYVTAKELNINSCNGANPDIYNIAYGFMQRTNITGTITGFDGGAKWDPNKEDHVRGDGDQIYGLKALAIGEWYYVQKYQSTWWKYVEKNKLGPIREREGRRYLR